MAEQRVTDEQLTEWAAEHTPTLCPADAQVSALIAEVRASRARQAELADEVDRLVELDRIHVALCAQFGAERDVLQQRIDKALAWCAKANPRPDLNGDQFAELRAALTGAAESHGERPPGPGTPADPVSGGTVQHSGRESGPDA